jgi:hypothetical protein
MHFATGLVEISNRNGVVKQIGGNNKFSQTRSRFDAPAYICLVLSR